MSFPLKWAAVFWGTFGTQSDPNEKTAENSAFQRKTAEETA
ncbi:hypothetical protein [Massilia eburnea]|nr:hypothetical protein [Massilia eburnea]